MHNPGKSCKLIKFSPLASLPEAEAEFLEETFDVVAVNYTDDGLEEYVGYAPLDFDAEDFRRRVAARGLKLPLFCEETLESKNWLKENVIKFAPFEIGAFMVYGIHEAACPPTEKIPVQVYAATAFGSEHQTTKMCLSLISRLYEDFPTPQKFSIWEPAPAFFPLPLPKSGIRRRRLLPPILTLRQSMSPPAMP